MPIESIPESIENRKTLENSIVFNLILLTFDCFSIDFDYHIFGKNKSKPKFLRTKAAEVKIPI